MPKVSIVVPVFNEAPANLEDALSSLINQTFGDFECIVVDESTQPGLVQVCKRICARDPRFRHVRPPARLGLPGSLNLGISLSRGEMIARFDSDDICKPERLELQVAFMDANKAVGVVGACIEIIGNDGGSTAMRKYPRSFAEIERKIHFTTALAHPSVMYRASVVRDFGGYDTSFRHSEDLDLWLRWLNCGVIFANLPEALVKYRQGDSHRQASHWRSNLRARVRNLSRRHLPYRLMGIVCISIWSLLPPTIQSILFRALVFSQH